MRKPVVVSFVIFVVLSFNLIAQDTVGVYIGYEGTSPHASAILDIDVDDKGVLLPRLSSNQRSAIANPANGLVIFNTDTRKIEYYDVDEWKSLSPTIWNIDTSGSISVDSINVGIGVNNPQKKLDVMGDFRFQSGDVGLESPFNPFDEMQIGGIGFISSDTTSGNLLLNGILDLFDFSDGEDTGYVSIQSNMNFLSGVNSLQAVSEDYILNSVSDSLSSQGMVQIGQNMVLTGVENDTGFSVLYLDSKNINLVNESGNLRNRLRMFDEQGIELSMDLYGQYSDKISRLGFYEDGVHYMDIEAMAGDTNALERIMTGVIVDTSDYRVYFDDSLHSTYTQIKLDKNGLEVYAGDYSQGDSNSRLMIDAQRFYYNKDIHIGGERYTDVPRLYIKGKGTDSTTVALLVHNNSNDDLLTVLDNGNVGIGTGTPTESLDVDGNIVSSGTVTASCGVLSCSDFRYKTNFKPLPDALSRISNLKGQYFTYRDKEFPEMGFTDRQQIGLIAQEVNKEFPELVDTMSNGYLSVNYAQLSVVLLEALKEQALLIEEIDKEHDSYSGQIKKIKISLDDLDERLNKLESMSNHNMNNPK